MSRARIQMVSSAELLRFWPSERSTAQVHQQDPCESHPRQAACTSTAGPGNRNGCSGRSLLPRPLSVRLQGRRVVVRGDPSPHTRDQALQNPSTAGSHLLCTALHHEIVLRYAGLLSAHLTLKLVQDVNNQGGWVGLRSTTHDFNPEERGPTHSRHHALYAPLTWVYPCLPRHSIIASAGSLPLDHFLSACSLVKNDQPACNLTDNLYDTWMTPPPALPCHSLAGPPGLKSELYGSTHISI